MLSSLPQSPVTVPGSFTAHATLGIHGSTWTETSAPQSAPVTSNLSGCLNVFATPRDPMVPHGQEEVLLNLPQSPVTSLVA